MTKFLYVLIYSFLGISAYSQNSNLGWNLIKDNNILLAQHVFEEQLDSNYEDTVALKGLIFISNLLEDNLSYKKHINNLYEFTNNEKYFTLFQKLIYKSTNSIIADTNLTSKCKINAKYELAKDKKRERKFTQENELYSQVNNSLDWAYLGPFQDINGYGFSKSFLPETDSFDIEKNYYNYINYKLNWVHPKYTKLGGKLFFNEHLSSNSNAVLFANSFFSINNDSSIQIRISRKNPIKIWLDDCLVFSNNEWVEFNWDSEIVVLKVQKGNHRIMVKSCTSRYFSGVTSNMKFTYDVNSISNFSLFQELYPEELTIRITDSKGNVIKGLKSEIKNTKYPNIKYQVSVISKQEINYFVNEIKNDSSNWFNYYMLLLAYERNNIDNSDEIFFVGECEKHENSVFFKYLLYRFYNNKGQIEKANRFMANIDFKKNPILSVLLTKVKEIDEKNNDKKYITSLLHLHDISDSNKDVIGLILDFYNEQGMKEQRIKFAKLIIEKYPSYEYRLRKYIKDNNIPFDYDIGRVKTNYRKLRKKTKIRFEEYDYSQLISYYKNKNKSKIVLALYDELINIEKYNKTFRFDKAEYLFNLGQFDNAINELQIIILINPYFVKAYELIGDVYTEKQDNAKALEYYKLAKEKLFNEQNYFLDKKIEKLEGQKQWKNMFETKSFEELKNDFGNRNGLENEESAVLGYTSDIVVEKNGKLHWFTKLLIKIYTEVGVNSWTQYDFASVSGNIKTIKIIKADSTEIIPDYKKSFVVFKNLEIGDLIQIEGEFEGNINSEIGKNLNMHNILTMQVPINYAKLEVAVTTGDCLQYKCNNIEDNHTFSKHNGYDFYKWEYKNLPKLTNEIATLDDFDIYANIALNTIVDWTRVIEWFKAKTYRKLEFNYQANKELEAIVDSSMTDEKKVEEIYNYITKNINYSYNSFLQNNYIPKNVDLTNSSKIGDCKDVSTLMINMLRQVGIESYYVLVKTNYMYHKKALPGLNFDHVIVAYYLNDRIHYVDLVSDFYPYFVLNEADIDAWALLIKDGETELFKLPNDILNSEKNFETHDINVQIKNDKSAIIKVKSIHKGMIGGKIREMLHDKTSGNVESTILQYMGNGSFNNLSLLGYKFENPGGITQALVSEYNFLSTNFMDNASEYYFFNIPYMIGINQSLAMSTKKRVHTLDLCKIVNINPSLQKITVKFDGNKKLVKTPKDINIESEFGTYKVIFKEIENGIYIEKYQAFKQSKIPANKFEAFKKYYLSILNYDKSNLLIK